MNETRQLFREFTDSDKVVWRVWEVSPDIAGDKPFWDRRRIGVPPHASLGALSADLQDKLTERRKQWSRGWLLFECATESRRLMPIPADWSSASAFGLEAMCRKATSVRT